MRWVNEINGLWNIFKFFFVTQEFSALHKEQILMRDKIEKDTSFKRLVKGRVNDAFVHKGDLEFGKNDMNILWLQEYSWSLTKWVPVENCENAENNQKTLELGTRVYVTTPYVSLISVIDGEIIQLWWVERPRRTDFAFLRNCQNFYHWLWSCHSLFRFIWFVIKNLKMMDL